MDKSEKVDKIMNFGKETLNKEELLDLEKVHNELKILSHKENGRMEENKKKTVGMLAHQFGKFGEGLVLWWLGQFYEFNVALVDHEGADIIAHKSDEHLAISVKSGHRASFEFDSHNQNKLKNFALKFGELTPAVAFVFVDEEKHENTKLDVFLIMLEDMNHFCDTNEKGFSRPKKVPSSCQVSNGANFETLKILADKNPNIRHLRMQQTSDNFKVINRNKGETK